ncbi:MAG: hypothetical protein LBT45_03960 [Rickettsiales bacterium]|jgi:hypothetical protein|nr:hypothetical protein [Rickettsiales bacterium]
MAIIKKTPFGQRQKEIFRLQDEVKALRAQLAQKNIKSDEMAEQFGERMQRCDEECAAEVFAHEERAKQESAREFRFNQLSNTIKKHLQDGQYFEVKSGMEISLGKDAGFRKVFFRGSTPDELWDWRNSTWKPDAEKKEADPLMWDFSSKGAFGESGLKYGETLDEVLNVKNENETLIVFYDGAHCFLVRARTEAEKAKARDIVKDLREHGRFSSSLLEACSYGLILLNDSRFDGQKIGDLSGVIDDVPNNGVMDPEENDKLDLMMRRGKNFADNNKNFAMLMAAGQIVR